jgi:hypothetical protein
VVFINHIRNSINEQHLNVVTLYSVRNVLKYTIKNTGGRAIDTIFAPELNVTMPDADSDRYRVFFDGEAEGCRLGETVEAEDARKAAIRDSQEHLSWELEVSEACRVWHFPLRTVSQSEKAYELNYQGSVILPAFKVTLAPGQERELKLAIKLVS